MLAFPRAATEHLLKEDAGLYRTEKDDEFEVGNIDSRREHVDGHDDAGKLAVAKFTDALKRPVDAAGDFLDERVAPAKCVASKVYELVGV